MQHAESNKIRSIDEHKNLATFFETWNEQISSTGYQYRRGFEDAVEFIFHRIMNMSQDYKTTLEQVRMLYIDVKDHRLNGLQQRILFDKLVPGGFDK